MFFLWFIELPCDSDKIKEGIYENSFGETQKFQK